jgi:uncharacterized damage-inducible protein DinB
MNRDLIEAYARGAQSPAEAIAGLSPQQLNAFPVPGTWSIQQIVLHLMDSDLIASDRMKRVIAENEPQLIGYDESAFARNLHYEKLDAQAACQIFALNRQLTAVILRNLPDAAFDRAGMHNETGRLTLTQLVQTYVNHLEHHLRYIRQKREKMRGE